VDRLQQAHNGGSARKRAEQEAAARRAIENKILEDVDQLVALRNKRQAKRCSPCRTSEVDLRWLD